MEIFDWDSIQIVETHDDEGRIALMSENQICELLGLIASLVMKIALALGG